MSDLDTVRVALRVRPFSQAEIERGYACVVKVLPGTHTVVTGEGKLSSDRFAYNHAFGPDGTQQQLYEQAVVQLLAKLFQGFNATILAYGQTSSGKTFTMGTDFTGVLGDNVGVIPRAVSDIFRMIEGRLASGASAGPVSVTCSFVELYQENLFDLLSKNRQSIDIREGTGGVVMLQGLTEVPVSSVQATLDCLVRGSAGRCVGATAMNSVSSRSHAIFTINITQPSVDDPSSTIKSKFHLVDLAGSERSKKTQATGDRFKEGVKINQGLLALGNVISALSSAASASAGVAGHVPYRDSKLTRLLQDSLGGNSYTLMIACVSPADYNIFETMSTLRYADRVCKIRNKPVVNIDPHRQQIMRLEATIRELRTVIQTMKNGDDPDAVRSECPIGPNANTDTISPTLVTARMQQLVDKNRLLQAELQSMVRHLATNEMRALTAEKTLEDIEAKVVTETKAIHGKDGDIQMTGDVPVTPGGEANDSFQSFIGTLLAAYKEERCALELTSPNVRGAGDDSESLLAQPSLGASGLPQSEVIQEASDSHTQQQIRMHNELSELNHVLAVKEQLHRRCLGIGEGESSITTCRMFELTEKLREHESTIQGLEAQLAEQNGLLEVTKVDEKMSKLSEERRRKVRQLEAELAATRQKSAMLANQLKGKEKDAQRVAGLSVEIQTMKAARVKLLKTMRTEQENFRQWRQNQVKEICQLKAKDRRRQHEMQKMESMHSLQKKVMQRKMDVEKKMLQRKMDETAAVNRRLKAALDRGQRKYGGEGKDRRALRGSDATGWIEHELELMHSAVDAAETLKLLLKQRDEQAEKFIKLQAQAAEAQQNGGEEYSELSSELLEEELAHCQTILDCRNVQIAELEQKLRTVKIDEQLATISDTLATLPEARVAFHQLLKAVEERDAKLVAARFQAIEAQEANDRLEYMMMQIRAVDRDEIDELWKDKMSVQEQHRLLLHCRKKRPHADSDEDDTSPRPDARDDDAALIAVAEKVLIDYGQLRDELQLYKASNQQLQRQLEEARERGGTAKAQQNGLSIGVVKSKNSRQFTDLVEEDEEEEEELDEEFDGMEESEKDLEADPTFRGTPISKRKKSEPIVPNVDVSRRNSDNTETIHTSCSCNGVCSTKRCGCRKMNLACSEHCKCPPGCVNNDTSNTEMPPPPAPHNVGQNATNRIKVEQDDLENSIKAIVSSAAPITKHPLDDEMDILTYVKRNKKRKPLIDL